MDVLFICTKNLLDSDYATLYSQIEYWKHAGHEITILTNKIKNERLEKDGLTLRAIKVPNLIFSFVSYIWKMTRKTRYDIHVYLISSPLSLALYSRKKSFIIVDFQSQYFDKFLAKFVNKKHKYLVRDQATYNTLADFGVKKTNLLLLVEEVKVPRKMPRKQKIILGVAGSEKNLVDVLAVFKGIERKQLDWKYILISEKLPKSELVSNVVNIDLRNKIKCVSDKNAFANKKFLQKGKFLVISDTFVNRGNLLNLANAHGCVRMQVTDAYAKNTKDIQKGNVYQIVDAILMLSTNSKEYERLQKEGRSAISELSGANISEKSVKFIESV
jgi:glycosyltransferase involved in cell wall biosynthesis